MNEIEVLTRLRAEVPAAVTSRAEDRLLAAIRARPDSPTADGGPGASRVIARPWAAPWRWRLAIAVGLVIALAAGSTVVTAEIGGGTAPAAANTVALLARTAAAHAAALPQVAADQWVYRKTLDRTEMPGHRTLECVPLNSQHPVSGLPSAFSRASAGKPCTAEYAQPGARPMRIRGIVMWVNIPASTSTQQNESWSTADGTRSAAYDHGKLVVSAACPCGFTSYADLATLPPDPKDLVRYLMRAPGGQQGHWTTAEGAWNAFNGIWGELMGYVVSPKAAAELYLALGEIPGVTVDKNAVDTAGRHGPALVLTNEDMPGGPWTAEIFLNPSTYQLMGYGTHIPAQCRCPSPGSGERAILDQALVSGPGVRP